MKSLLRQILLASLLVCVQALTLDSLQLRGIIGTMVLFNIYYFYIVLMPMGMPSLYLLAASFGLGFAMDLFSDTLGIHAATCVFTGFVRIHLLGLFRNSRERFQPKIRPSIYTMGYLPFLYYALILSFCYFLVLCSLEAFSFHRFYIVILRAMFSTIVNVVILMVMQTIFGRTIR